MLVTLLLGLFCSMITGLDSVLKGSWGLRISFLFLFLFLALRYNFGNDYQTYIELFNKVKENGDVAFDQSMYIFYEPGWMLLNWLCVPIGFFGMTIILALFYSITIYKLIKKYIPYQYYWIAIFFVVFNPGFLLVHSTTMRQTVAILIVLMSINFIFTRKIIPFILCIFLAATFHYTSLTVLLISPFLFYGSKVGLIYGSFLFLTYLMIFIFGTTVSPYFGQLVSMFSERYEEYSDKGNVNSGLGFLFYTSVFLLVLLLDRFQEKKIALFFKLAIVYFMLMPFTLIIEMTSRIGMYFAPAIIIVYPYIFKTLNSKVYKTIFLPILMLFTIYQFFQFFYSDTYKNYFMEYQTFFSSPDWK
jgi:hypothetical protein